MQRAESEPEPLRASLPGISLPGQETPSEQPTGDGRHRLPRPHFRRVHMPKRVSTIDSLRLHDFRLYWTATMLVAGAFFVQNVVVGWLAYDLTRSAFLTSVTLGVAFLPMLVMGPIGGLLADGWDRKKLVISAAAYSAAITGIFAVLVVTDVAQFWYLFAYNLMAGIAFGLAGPSRISMVANIVPKENLINAFALNEFAASAMSLVVPTIAGVLIATIDPGYTLLLAVVMNLGGAVVLMGVKVNKSTEEKEPTKSPLTNLKKGFSYIRGERTVLSIIMLGVLPPLLVFPFLNGLLPVYAAEVFEVGPVGLGLLMSAGGAGAMVGTIAMATIGTVRNRGLLMVGSVGVMIVFVALFSRISAVGIAVPILVVLAMLQMVFFTLRIATIQSIVPDRLRGRVAATSGMIVGLYPLGALVAGTMAELMGAPNATLIAVGLMGLALLAFVLKFRGFLALR